MNIVNRIRQSMDAALLTLLSFGLMLFIAITILAKLP